MDRFAVQKSRYVAAKKGADEAVKMVQGVVERIQAAAALAIATKSARSDSPVDVAMKSIRQQPRFLSHSNTGS